MSDPWPEADVLPGLSLTLGTADPRGILSRKSHPRAQRGFHLPGSSPYRGQMAREEVWEVSTDSAPSSVASESKGLSLELNLSLSARGWGRGRPRGTRQPCVRASFPSASAAAARLAQAQLEIRDS